MKIGLFGASHSTQNLGVAALANAVMTSIWDRMPETEFLVFDYGHGIRTETIESDSGPRSYKGVSNVISPNVLRHDNLLNMHVLPRLRSGGNPYLALLKECDCMLDITGGDSFTDMYGTARFYGSYLRKRLVARLGIPLLLLPQTYGPFSSRRHERLALRAIAPTVAAYARDQEGIDYIRELARRHGRSDVAEIRPGVDVAFLLKARQPAVSLPDEVNVALANDSVPLVGINVSGLLTSTQGSNSFSLSVPYAELIRSLITRIVRESSPRILMVPHVGRIDHEGAAKILNDLPAEIASHVTLVPPGLDECETKWLISHCDWFAGSRMHATIAALSTRVPTVNLAYSKKAIGVFETCNLADCVVSLRQGSASEIIDRVLDRFRRREMWRGLLERRIPAVVARAGQMMSAICDDIRAATAPSSAAE